jgi:nucleotide-binding universal stress UspA family protein
MMKEIHRILVGVDFSPTSDRALAYAATLAQKVGAELLLLHVYQIPAFAFPETIVPAPPETIDRLIGESRKHLEALAERVRSHGVSAAIDLVPGAAFAEIVSRAREGNFDLVVVGTHGRTGLRHALLGSVAEKVVRKSPVPVLTVRDSDQPFELP